MKAEWQLGWLVVLAVLVGVFPVRVRAYLDPGSGSYLLQLMLGVVFGGLFAVKVYWRRIKEVVRKLLGRGMGNEKKQD